jgi:hypothetical protein
MYETIFKLFDINWKYHHDVVEYLVDEVEAKAFKSNHPRYGIIRYNPTGKVAYYNGASFKARITW